RGSRRGARGVAREPWRAGFPSVSASTRMDARAGARAFGVGGGAAAGGGAVLPDVLHLNQFHCGAYDFGPPKLVVAHSDVLTWWRHVKGEEPPRDSWFQRYRDGVEAGLRGAQARLAPS